MTYSNCINCGKPKQKRSSSKFCSAACCYNKNTIKLDKNLCWLWKGKVDKNGYGVNLYDYKGGKAHRYACELISGPCPPCHEAAHSCDNTSCVNPYHLSWKTHADNMNDIILRDRQNILRGEKASSSKLKNEDVIIIKKLLKNWKIGDDVKIAKKFNVNRETIRAIRLNKAWKHIIIENDDENK